jgi:hypothetical protein
LREDCFFAADFFAVDFLADDRLADDDRAEDDRFADDRLAEDVPADLRVRLPDLVSPASRRCLFTVAAAIRLAVAVLRPCFLAEDLIFSYCRVRFALLTPRGGIDASFLA